MSQYDLAKAIEVSRQAVSKWESDQSSPDARNLVRLTEILDTDLEYLTTGRRTYGRRPPVVIKSVETVEKIVEKPVVQVVEKVVEKVVPSPPVIQTVEKPVLKKVYRTKYVRNPIELAIVGVLCFLAGLLAGSFL
ncbi:MAG: helix-turn-helix transcriptional regulator [Oscillospiraceae bacterium]|nr:helix-turn-helix transcriptional regulator [Oscillospiraceae bacterium]